MFFPNSTFDIDLLFGAPSSMFSLSNMLFTILDLIPKFVFSGKTPKFLCVYFKSSFATATLTLLPILLKIGPMLFPGSIILIYIKSIAF